MSYDRYLAICNPLHYNSIMDVSFCLRVVGISWFYSFMSTLVVVIQLWTLKFCGSNIIDHYYCDLTPLLHHSCSDTSLIEREIFVFSFPIAIFPFVFIILTYVRIVVTIIRIPSTTGKQKAFSTCSSHLTVVCTYYLTLITIYVIPSKGNTLNLNKFLSLLYTVLTPLFNPIIYSLRNKEIRQGSGCFGGGFGVIIMLEYCLAAQAPKGRDHAPGGCGVPGGCGEHKEPQQRETGILTGRRSGSTTEPQAGASAQSESEVAGSAPAHQEEKAFLNIFRRLV
ncbi:olfactory receptor 1M1-like [Discoglossus pictus]